MALKGQAKQKIVHGVTTSLEMPLGILSHLQVSSKEWLLGLSSPLHPNPPACLDLLTFLVLGELSLQILQLCMDLALLSLCIS